MDMIPDQAPALKHRAKLKNVLSKLGWWLASNLNRAESRLIRARDGKRIFGFSPVALAPGLVIFLFLFTIFVPAHAQTPAPTPIPDDAVNAIARHLYCPVCQNVTLEVCPTEACSRWREQVRELIGQGKTEPEIRDYFVEKFGMRTVGVPTNSIGQFLTVGVPFLLVLLGGGYLALQAIQRRNRTSPLVVDQVDSEAVIDLDYAARLEQELKERK